MRSQTYQGRYQNPPNATDAVGIIFEVSRSSYQNGQCYCVGRGKIDLDNPYTKLQFQNESTVPKSKTGSNENSSVGNEERLA